MGALQSLAGRGRMLVRRGPSDGGLDEMQARLLESLALASRAVELSGGPSERPRCPECDAELESRGVHKRSSGWGR
jgi:hypothetical protein